MKHMYQSFLIVIFCSCFVPFSFGQENPPSHLENQGLLIIEDRVLVNAKWSSNGQFVSAVALRNDGSELATDIYLWDVSQKQQQVFPPINSIELQDDRYIDIAFSSDGEYLAVRRNGELAIYTIPELELFGTIQLEPFPDYGIRARSFSSVTWSKEGHWVLTFDHLGQELITWNVTSNQQIQYDTGYQFELDLLKSRNVPSVSIVDEFWLLIGLGDDDSILIVCELTLSTCEPHSTESKIISSTSGMFDQMVLGVWKEDHFIWQTDLNIINTIFDKENIRIHSISPQEKYLFVCTDKQESQIVDLETEEIVNMIHQYDEDEFCFGGFLDLPIWFQNENNFIIIDLFYGLKLYEIGLSEPIQILTFPDLPNGIQGFADYTRPPIINDDASMILTNMMGFIHITRIEYK